MLKLPRRQFLGLTVKVALVAGVATRVISSPSAWAQTFPTRPITIVVPVPAGGTTDTLARLLADGMMAMLGQPVIVENISGGAGSIGVGRVARAAPDGYTLSIGNIQTNVLNGAVYDLPYDVLAGFEPVSPLADTALWIVGRNTLPAKDIKELIAWMKANPGKPNIGTVGRGGLQDIVAVYFQGQTGTNFQLVPYRGGAPLLQDLVGGQIDLTFGPAANYLAQVRGGQLTPYAVLAAKRWWAAPEVPTMDEAGVPGLHASFWHGLWAPRGTPKDVVAKLHAAAHDVLADAAVRQRLSVIGQELFPPEQQTPEALAALQKAEGEKWWPIIKAANIKGE